LGVKRTSCFDRWALYALTELPHTSVRAAFLI
jgi:hypothetical protein